MPHDIPSTRPGAPLLSPTASPGHFETILTDLDPVACDGGGGALGHPRVWLTLDAHEHTVTCPYCSRTYLLRGHASGAHGYEGRTAMNDASQLSGE